MENSITTAGIDTSKATLDIAFNGDPRAWKFENNPKGWRKIVTLLAENNISRAGIEASGGYETGIIDDLRDNGITVFLLQPVQVKAYARLTMKRAKNDSLDAKLIAECAAAITASENIPDKRLQMLAQHLSFAEQNEEDIARLKVRLEHIRVPAIVRTVKADIGRLKLRLAALLKRIERDLRHHQDIANRLDLVCSVPGIGMRTALTLIVRMPELGSISREQAASLAGLAPFDDDSGKRSGMRFIAGGRGRVRKSLYMAALAAAFRWNPALVAFYKRLTARGKPHKAALTACARKLLIFANTVLARGQPWIQKTAAQT